MGDSLSDQSEHYAKFLIDAGFYAAFNPKDKVALNLSLIFSLVLIVASDAEFHSMSSDRTLAS